MICPSPLGTAGVREIFAKEFSGHRFVPTTPHWVLGIRHRVGVETARNSKGAVRDLHSGEGGSPHGSFLSAHQIVITVARWVLPAISADRQFSCQPRELLSSAT